MAGPPGTDEDDRISLVFRVGVTGHRWLAPDDEAARLAVGTALEAAFRRCSNRATEHTPVEQAVVSSLADGADRLAAEWAVAHGLRLEVVLPMEPETYAADFATHASRAQFWRLVRSAEAVVVMPPRASREDAYRMAGQAVAERSDVLLAVWDGRPAKGIGGTAEIVGLAGRLGVPVSWVQAERHDGGPATYRPVGVGDAPVPGLRGVPEHAGPLSDPAFDLLDAFNRTPLPPRHRAPLGPTDDPTARRLSRLHHRADVVALRARDAVVGAGRAVHALAVVAVATIAGQLVFFPGDMWLVWFGSAALAATITLLVRARRSCLLDRWISARALADRLRSGYYLALIGTSPVLGPIRADAETPTAATEWTGRVLREALLRTTTRTPGRFDLEVGRSLLLQEWLDPLLRHHTQVARAATRSLRLGNRGAVVLFGISLLAALLHVLGVLSPEGAPEYWTYTAIVASAAATALSGYPAQRDHVRRRWRAEMTVQHLTQGRASVARAATLSELRRAAEAVDLVVQGASADWFAAARLHGLEAP